MNFVLYTPTTCLEKKMEVPRYDYKGLRHSSRDRRVPSETGQLVSLVIEYAYSLTLN